MDIDLVCKLRDEISTSIALVGGKAVSLAQLAAVGVKVPPTIIISTAAYSRHITLLRETLEYPDFESAIDDPESGREELERVRAAILRQDVEDCLVTSIKTILPDILLDSSQTPPTIAVRSSATCEDLANASFAGQHDSFLGTPVGELLSTIKRCWASLWTDRAVYYRRQHGFSHYGIKMAVILQSMLCPESAGTMFTINPVTGATEELLIESNWGLGETVVSGKVTPDLFVAQFNGASVMITERHIRPKRGMLTMNKAGSLHYERIIGARIMEPSLADEHVLAIAQYGRKIASALGCPLDLEWAMQAQTLYILQARPITSRLNTSAA